MMKINQLAKIVEHLVLGLWAICIAFLCLTLLAGHSLNEKCAAGLLIVLLGCRPQLWHLYLSKM